MAWREAKGYYARLSLRWNLTPMMTGVDCYAT